MYPFYSFVYRREEIHLGFIEALFLFLYMNCNYTINIALFCIAYGSYQNIENEQNLFTAPLFLLYSFLLEKLGLLMDFLPCVGIQKIVLQLHSGYCLVLFCLKVMSESGYCVFSLFFASLHFSSCDIL